MLVAGRRRVGGAAVRTCALLVCAEARGRDAVRELATGPRAGSEGLTEEEVMSESSCGERVELEPVGRMGRERGGRAFVWHDAEGTHARTVTGERDEEMRPASVRAQQTDRIDRSRRAWIGWRESERWAHERARGDGAAAHRQSLWVRARDGARATAMRRRVYG